MDGTVSEGSNPVPDGSQYADLKYIGYLGYLSIAVFTVCSVIGACLDEEWVLFENNLCVLGISDLDFVRFLYPVSCTITGLGMMMFGYSMGRTCDRRLQALGYYSCILFGISLICIGAFNLDSYRSEHMISVYAMGISATFVMGFITVDDIRHRKWAISAFVIFMAVGFILLTMFKDGCVQPFTITCMFIWLFIKSRHMVQTGSAY